MYVKLLNCTTNFQMISIIMFFSNKCQSTEQWLGELKWWVKEYTGEKQGQPT